MKRFLVLFLAGGFAFAQGPSPSASMAVIGPGRTAPAPTTRATDSDRLWLDLLPQAHGQTTLVGGTIRKLDQVRDTVTVRIFGGRDVVVLFDDRTRFYRDGLAASARELQTGQRVYVDTALAGSDIFARSVRVLTQSPNGQSSGQIQSYDPSTGDLILRDVLSPEPAKFRLAPNAAILRDGHTVSSAELRPGSLVSLKFGPAFSREDGRLAGPAGPGRPASTAIGAGEVREVSILAAPGGTFVFAGRISHLDLHTGLLVLVDPRDLKTYDIHFDPAMTGIEDRLHEGGDVTVTTSFDGAGYTANSIVVSSVPGK